MGCCNKKQKKVFQGDEKNDGRAMTDEEKKKQ